MYGNTTQSSATPPLTMTSVINITFTHFQQVQQKLNTESFIKVDVAVELLCCVSNKVRFIRDDRVDVEPNVQTH